MLLSAICLVHCLGGALLLATLSVAGGWLSHELHAIGLAVAMPLAAVALWRGVQLHGRWDVVALGALGIGLMAGSLFAAHGARAELWLSVLGVSVLAAAHVWNMRAVRR